MWVRGATKLHILYFPVDPTNGYNSGLSPTLKGKIYNSLRGPCTGNAKGTNIAMGIAGSGAGKMPSHFRAEGKGI